VRRAALLIVMLACAGCATQAPPPLPPPPDPVSLMPALEERIAILVEEERMKLDPDARPLAIDSELSGIARERSRDMAAKHYFAHKAPDGDTSASLLMAQDAKYQGLLGENMAALHYTKQTGVDVNVFAKKFLDYWMASPAHRDNFSFAKYDRTGIGAALDGDTIYVTQLFSADVGALRTEDAAPGASAP